jgi:hypothetical protein
VNMVHRKAIQTGGGFSKIPTQTALSSRCLCGRREKKPLRVRRHECGCDFIPKGTWGDRDAFSAFLALSGQKGELDEQAARRAWAAWGADGLLRSSSSPLEAQSATGVIPNPGIENVPPKGGNPLTLAMGSSQF